MVMAAMPMAGIAGMKKGHGNIGSIDRRPTASGELYLEDVASFSRRIRVSGEINIHLSALRWLHRSGTRTGWRRHVGTGGGLKLTFGIN